MRFVDERLFWKKVDRRSDEECWEWKASKNALGYGHFNVKLIGDGGSYRHLCQLAHRVSYELAHGFLPNALVLHSCDNPGCVNPSHLREGTDWDNSQDKKHRGRFPCAIGASNANAKLSEQDVRDMRSRREGGEKVVDLARYYGVHRLTVSRIVAGRKWTHI